MHFNSSDHCLLKQHVLRTEIAETASECSNQTVPLSCTLLDN